MKRWLALVAGRVPRCSPAAAARATRTCARGWPSRARARTGKLEPLPQMKPYEPFAYNAFDLPDPFKPRKIEPTKGGSKLAPDLDPAQGAARGLSARVARRWSARWRRTRRRTRWCARRTRTSTRCAPGNYMGQNFGVDHGDHRQRDQAEGTGPGRRRRLDRAVQHAAAASRPTRRHRSEDNERVRRLDTVATAGASGPRRARVARSPRWRSSASGAAFAQAANSIDAVTVSQGDVRHARSSSSR